MQGVCRNVNSFVHNVGATNIATLIVILHKRQHYLLFILYVLFIVTHNTIFFLI